MPAIGLATIGQIDTDYAAMTDVLIDTPINDPAP